MVMGHFDYSRAAIGPQCLGAARASLTETYAHTHQRRSFGKPIAAFQGVTAARRARDEMPFQQRFRDVFGYQIGDGTAQIQQQIIASRLIGAEVRDR